MSTGRKLGCANVEFPPFFSDPAHQLSQVWDIPALFPGLSGHNVWLMKFCFVYLDIKSTADLGNGIGRVVVCAYLGHWWRRALLNL